jgi:hypothetical protein
VVASGFPMARTQVRLLHGVFFIFFFRKKK